MRRKDREVLGLDRILEIVRGCSVAHLGMVEDGKPYVVALNFGYERQGDALVLYFHSACEGRKIQILKKDPKACFQMDCAGELVPGTRENPCAYGWRYDSVMGSGRVEFIEDPQEKTHALSCILRHAGGVAGAFEFPEEMLRQTCVYRLVSADVTAKHHE